MYKEINYKVDKNKIKKIFRLLVSIGLSEFGMFSLFNIGPSHDKWLKLGYLRIYGEEEYVNKITSKFRFHLRGSIFKNDIKEI